MAKKTRSGSLHRKNKYKAAFVRTQKNKDKNVLKSSHGKFKTVAQLEDYKKRNKKD